MQDGSRTIEKWQLSTLKPHPKQSTLFADAPPHEIEELAADIKLNGQLTPIEILRDGTIITGHKRVAAARFLGWTELDVWVRDDLEAEGAVAVERRLIDDNLNRRQLGPLGMARCYKHLKLLGRPIYGAGLASYENTELRDQIGKRLGVSGRTLDRYLRILDETPQEVQDAVAANKLPLTLAEKVAGLTQAQREQVAAEIQAGGDPRAVVCKFVVKANGRHKNAADAFGAFLRNLERGVADVENRLDGVTIHLATHQITLLDRTQAILDKVRKATRKPTKKGTRRSQRPQASEA